MWTWSEKLNEVWTDNCLEIFGNVPSNTFDMSFADPPFNLKKEYSNYGDDLKKEEYLQWSKEWMRQVIRVTKPGGSIFLHNIPKWLSHYNCIIDDFNDNEGTDCQFQNWIAWDAPTSPMGRKLQPSHYGILYFSKGSPSKVYQLRMPHKRCRSCNRLLKDYGGKKTAIHPMGPLVSDVWTDIHRCKHKKYRNEHPCQLPVALIERLILLCTDEGDSVFDCFLGTGTTAVAAKRLGRNYLGMEINDEYSKICVERLEQETSPSRLGSIWASLFLNDIYTVREHDIYDAKKKEFIPEWKSFFKDWPDSDDKLKSLNNNELVFTNQIRDKIVSLCYPKRTPNG